MIHHSRRGFSSLRSSASRQKLRRGFSLIELILFLGILTILSGTIIGLLTSTQDARIRQRSVASLEQNGANVLYTLTRRVRRAEAILDPPVQHSGAILALQMASASEYPTIFARNGSGNLQFVQATSLDLLLEQGITIQNMSFWNTSNASGKSALISFDLQTTIPLLKPEPYIRHFSAAVSLYPDDQSEAGDCGSCPVPVCINHSYSWSYCENEVCTGAPFQIKC